jgi:hypothetical protein
MHFEHFERKTGILKVRIPDLRPYQHRAVPQNVRMTQAVHHNSVANLDPARSGPFWSDPDKNPRIENLHVSNLFILASTVNAYKDKLKSFIRYDPDLDKNRQEFQHSSGI